MKYFPIIIFGYNRPELLKNCILSLTSYKDFKKHNFFFFCDGPKNYTDNKKINKIKSILNNSKIKFKKKIFKKKNLGLSSNIIGGVTSVLKKNKAAIIIEDDLYLDKNAIKFINFFLNKKKSEKKIGSISAYSYIHNEKFKFGFDCYYLKRHCSWAWGTWNDRWNKIDWDDTSIDKHFKNKKSINFFDKIGKDLNLLLWAHRNKYINSWAIRFNLSCMKNKLLSIQPRYSLVRNDGHGKESTHQKFKKNININNFFKIKNDFYKKKIKIIKKKEIDELLRRDHKRSLRLIILYFLSKINFFKIR